ncbi:Exportin 7 [Tritrichomonas musculus]|uniref:Exportin 7 n=1 Tax=Tritrichomonas musculus TaxID=1915356 RepID=A0ABR2HIH5_9EUKA
MEDEFKQFYDLIQAHNNDHSPETALKILNYSTKIEYLSFLQQFLRKCLDSSQHILLTFNFMRDIIKLRGYLMLPDELINHFMFVKQFIIENYQLLLGSQVLINSASQDIAMTIRFTYEQDRLKGEKLFDNVKELFDSDENMRIVAIIIMTSIVDCFKEPLLHLTFTEKTNCISEFKRKYLHIFANIVSPLIRDGNGLILCSSLNLLLHCFEFCDNKTTVSTVVYPVEYSTYFSSSEIITRIFELCFVQETSSISYGILFYMAAASGIWNSDYSNKNNFFNFFTNSMIQIISSQDQDSNFIGQTCRILNVLSQNLEPNIFFQQDFSQNFLNSALQFSGIVFELAEPAYLQNIFNFWGTISNWRLDSELMKPITETMVHLILSFFDATLNSISQNGQHWLTLFQTDFDNYGFDPIWKIANNCYKQVYEIIYDKITSKASENPANLLQLAFIVNVITSRFGKDIGSGNDEYILKIHGPVFSLIEQTTPLIKQILANDPAGIVFENSIVLFMDNYQRINLSGTRLPPTKIQNPQIAIQMEKKQNNINIFASRILSEFDSFQFFSSFPKIINRIFNLVTQLIKKEDCVVLIEKTPIKSALLDQNISISFEGVPPDIAKKSRINLYSLYTSLINTIKELQIFLNKFDIRFQQLAASNYSDPNEIFALFCDLRGVFKCLLTNASPNTLFSTKKKYVKVCNWFFTNHAQSSVEIIKNNSTDTFIVNIVCSIWISLFPDRFDQKSIQVQSINDGFGIILFKTSLLIIEAVVQNCANDFPKFYILFKVIRYCMTTKYANFGVMNFYGDNSFDRMSQLFFQLLGLTGFDNLSNNFKLLNHILRTMNAITNSEKCLNELFGNEDKTNLNLIITFTEKCMYLDSHNRETSKANIMANRTYGLEKSCKNGSKSSIGLIDMWTSSWDVLNTLLKKSLSTPELFQSVQMYRPHSILILNNVMMKKDPLQIQLGPILLATYIYDNQFANWLISMVINTYDEKFKEYVKNQFLILFNGISNPEAPVIINEVIAKEFESRLSTFSTNFMKYQTNFIDLPEIAQLL